MSDEACNRKARCAGAGDGLLCDHGLGRAVCLRDPEGDPSRGPELRRKVPGRAKHFRSFPLSCQRRAHAASSSLQWRDARDQLTWTTMRRRRWTSVSSR
jgi:hypothetical protein